jgi:hypothetical protein
MFSEGMQVTYKNMYGIVDFICEQYLTIKLQSANGRDPARLVIYPKDQKNVKSYKDSER